MVQIAPFNNFAANTLRTDSTLQALLNDAGAMKGIYKKDPKKPDPGRYPVVYYSLGNNETDLLACYDTLKRRSEIQALVYDVWARDSDDTVANIMGWLDILTMKPGAITGWRNARGLSSSILPDSNGAWHGVRRIVLESTIIDP